MGRKAMKQITKYDGGRHYTWKRQDGVEETYPSVTTIIGAMNKPALPRWAAKETAEFAVKVIDQISFIAQQDRQAAIDLLKGAPWRNSRKAMGRGSGIHKLIEQRMSGEAVEVPDRHRDSYGAFGAFLSDYNVSYETCETTVFSRTHNYAGTLDFIAKLDGIGTVVGDIKTGKNVWPEVGLQLAAYRYADFMGGKDGEEKEIPATTGAVVLHLRPDGYSLHPVRSDVSLFGVFLALRSVWQFQEEESNDVVGEEVKA